MPASYLNKRGGRCHTFSGLQKICAQIVDEGAAARASVIFVQLHTLQEHERPKYFDVSKRNGVFLGELFAQTVDSFLHAVVNACRDQIGGASFVIKAALQCTISANQRLKRVPDVEIDGARLR